VSIWYLSRMQVAYWKELQSFFERVRETDAALLSLCWGAMASLYHFHKVCHGERLSCRKNIKRVLIHAVRTMFSLINAPATNGGVNGDGAGAQVHH
jgi:homoserine O-succinyltransferase